MRLSQPWSFLLIGPPIASILMLAALGASPLTPALILAGLPIAYLLGALPALIVGIVDARLAARAVTPFGRAATAGALGAVTGTFSLLPLYLTGMVHGPLPLILPAIGAVTAVLCLLLHLLAGQRV